MIGTSNQKKEYYLKNREERIAYQRSYYHANKHIAKNYYQKNSLRIARYYEQNKTRILSLIELKRFGTSRQNILIRDNFKCQSCGSKENLHIHHKDLNGRDSFQPNNHYSNLITLCNKCHGLSHGKM